MTVATTRTPATWYDEETKDKALTIMVLCGGSGRKAHDQLAAAGIDIPRQTLEYWRNHEPDRYTAIATRIAPQVAERIATEAEEIAALSADVERQALNRLNDEISKLPLKELSTTLRNVSTAKALQIDKVASPLRGRPTVITSKLSVEEVLDRIARKVPDGVIDAEAVEIPEAEEVTVDPLSSQP